jgi:hypothetical protein
MKVIFLKGVSTMAHTVTVSIVTEQREFESNVVSGGIRVSLGYSRVQYLSAAPYDVVFANVEAGDYVINVAAVDNNGLVLGEAITGSVSIAADVAEPEVKEVVLPNVIIDVPTSLSVTVS